MSSYSISLIFTYCLLDGVHWTWGQPPKPMIRAIPGPVINKRGNVTIRCESEYKAARFVLSKVGDARNRQQDVDGYAADFIITNAKDEDGGYYYCNYYETREHVLWSHSSGSLTIKIIDLLKPEISWEKDPDDEGEPRITCTAPEPPEKYRVIRFFLHKNKSQFKDLNTKEWSLKVTFPVSASDPAIYKCSYVLDVLQTPQHHIESPLSDPLQPTKDKENNPTPSLPSIPEDKDAKDGDEDGLHGVWTYMIPVISAVCAILILILVVIIVCYFSRKRKTSQDTINNSVLPINDQMATEKEATYASVDEMKNSNVDVVMQKADNDDDDDGGGGGITYATLNMEALSMKKVSSSSPVESSLYAAVRR